MALAGDPPVPALPPLRHLAAHVGAEVAVGLERQHLVLLLHRLLGNARVAARPLGDVGGAGAQVARAVQVGKRGHIPSKQPVLVRQEPPLLQGLLDVDCALGHARLRPLRLLRPLGDEVVVPQHAGAVHGLDREIVAQRQAAGPALALVNGRAPQLALVVVGGAAAVHAEPPILVEGDKAGGARSRGDHALLQRHLHAVRE
mmetsp:Transcript_64749/g.166613  ORF Transcript_64749/g.166613 Transcript_64749/m.166613 type:complete len:201 (+) Transcript_64749:238-840(+)